MVNFICNLEESSSKVSRKKGLSMENNLLEEKAKEAKRAYYKNYREANKEKITARTKEWLDNNKQKKKQYNENYWKKKAEQLIESK